MIVLVALAASAEKRNMQHAMNVQSLVGFRHDQIDQLVDPDQTNLKFESVEECASTPLLHAS